jgi:hypothetical protein
MTIPLTAGPAAYAEARRCLEKISETGPGLTAAGHLAYASEALAWAKLADVALSAEIFRDEGGSPLVKRGYDGDEDMGESPRAASPWARAIYGDGA